MSTPPEDYEAPTREDQPPASSPADDFPGPDAPATDFPPETYDDALPVAVYDVTPAREPEIVQWSSGHTHLGGSADNVQQITGARRGRKRFVIWNEGAGAVYIGPTMQVQVGSVAKLPLMNNDRLVLEHNSAIYAAVAPGDQADLSYFEEYVVETQARSIPATE